MWAQRFIFQTFKEDIRALNEESLGKLYAVVEGNNVAQGHKDKHLYVVQNNRSAIFKRVY